MFGATTSDAGTRRHDRIAGFTRSTRRNPLHALTRAAVLAAAAGALAATPAVAAGPVTRTFTSAQETFIVPAGVTSLQVVAVGGEGGSNIVGTFGGLGARVTGELAVTPGQTLYVHVGGNGISGSTKWHGGTGGGSSDVRTAPLSAGLSPDTRLIVAGGGGGAGGQGENAAGNSSSEGGNAEESAEETGSASGGEGGTQTEGGAGGPAFCHGGESRPAGEGQLETGGEGGFCFKFGGVTGGGGGAGYYGGGGGGAGSNISGSKEGAAGGGGGSSLVPSGGTEALARHETPQVRISYMQPADPPTLVTDAASDVSGSGATLNATVYPEGEETTSCEFQYGTSESYGSSVPCSPASASGVNPAAVSADLAGLSLNTTYHYRIVAGNLNGISYGADASFTTLLHNPPTITSVSPESGAQESTVTITGTELEGATAVKFGSESVKTFTVNTPESITAVAHGATGTVPVTVTTPYGTSPETPAARFTFLPEPAITKITPAGGPGAGGTVVTIEGQHLEGASAVSFGAAGAESFKVNSESSITAVAPPGEGSVYVTVTTPGGTSSETPEAEFTYENGAPEFGRCVTVAPVSKGVYHGGYTNSSCLDRSPTETGRYEWEPGAARAGITTTGSAVSLEGTSITCTGVNSTGSITGVKSVGDVAIRFSGCSRTEIPAGPCTTAGSAQGVIESEQLEGKLGWEDRATKKVGLSLYPHGHTGPFIQFACGSGSTQAIDGAVILPLKAGKMLLSAKLAYSTSHGAKQKPEQFEGGVKEVLTQNEDPVGLVSKVTLAYEEKIEVNTVW